MEVEQISGVIGDPSTWKVRTVEETELVIVPNPSGFGLIKMGKAEAIRLGLWKEPEATAEKARPPARNKARRAGANKGA